MPRMARHLTLPALLEAAAADRGAGQGWGGRGWAEILERTARLAGGLAALGIGPGDRVGVFVPNRADLLTLIFALARRGACAILLNTRFRAAELAPLLARARPAAIAVSRDFVPVDAAGVISAIPAEARASLRVAIGVDDMAGGDLAGLRVHSLASLLAAKPAPDLSDPEAEALTFTTSGTTSGPKLVLHRQRSLAVHARAVAARIGTGAPGAAFLAAVPLCGTFGLSAALAAVAGGTAIHMLERFDAAAADALIRSAGISHMVGGDDLLLMLAEAAAGRPYAPFAFTGFANFHGGAERVMEASAALNLGARGVYGSSEAQALFALQGPEGPHRAVGGGVPASPEAAFAVSAEGELLLRGPSLFDSYLGDPEATARAWTGEGWFRSGDLATQHPDGRGFDFATRAGDALWLGGFLVAPEEIEGFLLAQQGVAAAQVVAAGGPAVAFVIPGEGFDAERLMAACTAQLARFRVPARIVPLEAFPMTDGPNGRKVQRARLREMAA
jgi:fatty-acyl-CoA synthase